MPKDCYADGGQVEGQDDEQLMDHCALECMNAIDKKDRAQFRESLHVLMAHSLSKLQTDDDDDDDDADSASKGKK